MHSLPEALIQLGDNAYVEDFFIRFIEDETSRRGSDAAYLAGGVHGDEGGPASDRILAEDEQSRRPALPGTDHGTALPRRVLLGGVVDPESGAPTRQLDRPRPDRRDAGWLGQASHRIRRGALPSGRSDHLVRPQAIACPRSGKRLPSRSRGRPTRWVSTTGSWAHLSARLDDDSSTGHCPRTFYCAEPHGLSGALLRGNSNSGGERHTPPCLAYPSDGGDRIPISGGVGCLIGGGHDSIAENARILLRGFSCVADDLQADEADCFPDAPGRSPR